MNTLLSILTGSQNGAQPLNVRGAIKEPAGQGLSKEAQSSGLPLPLAFSRILEGQGKAPKHIQEDVGSPVLSGRQHSGKFVDGEDPETANPLGSNSHIPGIVNPAETPLLSPRFQDLSLVSPVPSMPIPPNGVVPNSGLQASTEHSTLGFVRQDVASELPLSGTSPISSSKVLEGGLHPQSVSQGLGE